MNSNAASLSSDLNSHRYPLWQVFTASALMLMDLSWVTPTYMLLIGRSLGGSVGMAFLVFGVIYLSSYLVVNIFRRFEVFIGIIQVVWLAILIIGLIWGAQALLYFEAQLPFSETVGRYLTSFTTFVIPLKPEFILLITVFYLWRRGFSVANRVIRLGFIRKTFRLGSFVLLGIGVITALFGHTPPYFEAGLFLFSGLLAMGGARLSTLSSMRGGKGVVFNERWVVSLTAMAALVLTLSVGFGVFAAGPLSAWMGGFIVAVEGYIFNALKYLLAPLINFLGIIFAWFWSLFEPAEEVVDLTAVEALEEGLSGPIAEIQELSWGPQFASFLSTTATVVGILILLGIVLYTVRRFKSDGTARPPEEEDRISMAGSLSDYLRSVQNRVRQAFEGVTRMNPAARLIAAARIRIIYTRLLRLSARLGEPRAPAVTPIEFMDSLEKIFPASRDELDTITHAYLRVRYGELPETRQQVEAVESAWEHVRRRGQAVGAAD